MWSSSPPRCRAGSLSPGFRTQNRLRRLGAVRVLSTSYGIALQDDLLLLVHPHDCATQLSFECTKIDATDFSLLNIRDVVLHRETEVDTPSVDKSGMA